MKDDVVSLAISVLEGPANGEPVIILSFALDDRKGAMCHFGRFAHGALANVSDALAAC